MPQKKIKAVVFDIDGTLYPNYKMILTSILFFFRHPIVAVAFNRMRRKVRQMEPGADFNKLQADVLAKELNITQQKALFLLEEYIYGDFVAMFKWIKPYKILNTMLPDLKEKGLKLGIISDFPVGRKLSYLGFDYLWDVVCSANEIGYLKPRPESFLQVAQELGLLPGEIIYVGNHYNYDIIGADNAGMMSAWFSRCGKKDNKANLIFSSYKKLWNYILTFC